MSRRQRAAMSRMFAGTQRVLAKIEAGEDPKSEIRRMQHASPWHILAIGQAGIEDQLEAEDAADGVLEVEDE